MFAFGIQEFVSIKKYLSMSPPSEEESTDFATDAEYGSLPTACIVRIAMFVAQKKYNLEKWKNMQNKLQ